MDQHEGEFWKAACDAACEKIKELRAALHKLDRHFEDSGYNDGRIDFVGTFHDARRTIRAALDGVDERSTERPVEEDEPRHNPDAVYIDGR